MSLRKYCLIVMVSLMTAMISGKPSECLSTCTEEYNACFGACKNDVMCIYCNIIGKGCRQGCRQGDEAAKKNRILFYFPSLGDDINEDNVFN